MNIPLIQSICWNKNKIQFKLSETKFVNHEPCQILGCLNAITGTQLEKQGEFESQLYRFDAYMACMDAFQSWNSNLLL